MLVTEMPGVALVPVHVAHGIRHIVKIKTLDTKHFFGKITFSIILETLQASIVTLDAALRVVHVANEKHHIVNVARLDALGI